MGLLGDSGDNVGSNGTFNGEPAVFDQRPSGETDVFFGGRGDPLGTGHGHAVMDKSGENISYYRDSDKAGGQTYVDDRK